MKDIKQLTVGLVLIIVSSHLRAQDSSITFCHLDDRLSGVKTKYFVAKFDNGFFISLKSRDSVFLFDVQEERLVINPRNGGSFIVNLFKGEISFSAECPNATPK